MAKVKPRNKVRFAWWGGEESAWSARRTTSRSLPADEQQTIALYLNFDMVGSPNYVRFVYDGDDSAFPVGPVGRGRRAPARSRRRSTATSRRRAWPRPPDRVRRALATTAPFINIGIPAGGLFTGAEGVKTAAEAAIYGGTAGVAYDPCYHEACDTIANVNGTGFRRDGGRRAHAVLTFARHQERERRRRVTGLAAGTGRDRDSDDGGGRLRGRPSAATYCFGYRRRDIATGSLVGAVVMGDSTPHAP